MKRLFFFVIFCVSIVYKTNAQEQQFTFSNLNEKDGLRNNIIFCFLKDSHGILWIGTQNGLNRFDGSHFYTFKKNRDSISLPNNSIESLCEDKDGNIWGGTDNGVFCFTPSKSIFTTYYAPKDCYDNIISNILCDKQGNIYAATSLALMKFNKQSKTFQLVIKFTNNTDSVANYIIGKNKLLRDDTNDGFWITSRRGLMYYDNKQGKMINYLNSPHSTLFTSRRTSALARSPKGYFWFCDNDAKELIAFDPTTKKILQNISFKDLAPYANGSTILEDSQNRLWFSNWSYDLLTIDLANHNKMERIDSKEGNSNTIAANFFWAGLEDENGTIWLGTTNGISMCNPGKYVYKACHLPDKIPALKSTAIYLTEEDPTDKSWWIATEDLSIIHYYPGSGKYETFTLKNALANNNNLLPQNINQLRFLDGKVFVTTANGTWQLNGAAKKFIPCNLLPKEYSEFIITDFIAADSVVYFTNGQLIIAINNKTKKTVLLQQDIPHSKLNKKLDVYHLIWKQQQPLYLISFTDYITAVDVKNNINIIKIVKDAKAEGGGYFHAVDIDKDGNVWITNKGVGLYRYNATTGQTKYWTELDGLVDNHLHAIKADNNGCIWSLYFNRGCYFNPKENSFIHFTIPYSENNLNYFNNLTLRSDGVIMGNVNNDVFEFHSNNVNIKPIIKEPAFSVINISGKDYFLTNEKELFLNPDENSLRFKFGFLTDATLYPYEFEYILEGSDKKWVHSSISNEANYNNLAPGKYTFRLIAKGRNNAWQSAEKIITITIKTPFYKTYWFVLLVLLGITSAIIYVYRMRLLQKEKLFVLESKAQLLEKEKTMVMYESLKQQLNPHFLFNSLTSLSGLIETDQALAGQFLEQMSGIYRYILKNGNSETVTLKNEIDFVNLYISLQQTRFKKGLQVNINIPADYFHYKIAPVSLQNLIENAIKHNVMDAESPLVIDIFIEHDYVVVKNNLHKKNMVETSNKKGLAQFETLYKYLCEKPIIIEETNQYFIIKIPLI